jgi:hypothetical protein
MSKKPSYELDFSFPKGWVQLPVLENKKAFSNDKKVEAWSMAQAQTMLGAGATQEQLEHRARELAALTYGARARNDMYGLAFYPSGSPGAVALLDVKHLIPDRQSETLTFDDLRELYAKHSADTVGDVDESQTELPSGPALRIHRKRAEGGDPTGQGTIMEGVTYAIRPPGMDDAIVMIMTWAALQFGDRLAMMADAIAKTIKVRPA